MGSLNSSTLMVATREAPPAGLQPPRVVSNPDQLNILRVNWDPPEKPNGAPIFYKLYRDGVLVYSGDIRSFVDATDVAPFQTYNYWLVACNHVACVSSSKVAAATLESIPEGFEIPVVADINATCVNLTWVSPEKPNGLITKYIITLRQKDLKMAIGNVPRRDINVHTASPSTRWIMACKLKPYTKYDAELEACTQVGCRKSERKSFITNAAIPEKVPDPRVIVVNFIHIDVIWHLPYSGNGPIISSTLFRRRDGEPHFSKIISYDSSPTSPTVTIGSKTLNYSDFSVRPGYRYAYKVEFTNPAGSVNSSEILSYGVPLRPPSVPNRMPSAVTVNSPNEITVELLQNNQDPTSESPFDETIVLIESDTGVEREHFNGLTAAFDLLSPYTLYEARVKTCFRPPEATCSYSEPVFVRTKAAVPEGPPPPTAIVQSATEVALTWQPPEKPNGPIDRYEIYRRKGGESMSMIATIPVFETVDESDEDEVLHQTSYMDSDSKLLPFTTYEYRVAAVTSAGRGFSSWVQVRTSQAKPSMMRPLMVNQTGAYGAEFIWSPPEQTNGPLLHYKIEYKRLNAEPGFEMELPPHIFVVSSSRESVLISGLKPVPQRANTLRNHTGAH